MVSKIKTWFKNDWKDTKILLRNIPASILALFVCSIVAMNLLANKSINLNLSWLALDCGIIVSWLAFLSMDMLTKRFGPKSSTKVSIFALIVNLLVCLLFFIASKIPGTWGESYLGETVGVGLDNTVGGTWYVLLGSSIAFIVSAVVNNFLNYGISKLFKKNPDGFAAYAARSYGSTFVGQFVDNFVFALLVSQIFFGWSLLQCFTCALTGAIVELLFEVFFSPIGFKIVKRWDKENVGQEYLDFQAQKNSFVESEILTA